MRKCIKILDAVEESFSLRIWQPAECVTFCKVDEPFGGLSNMAGGYPILVQGIEVKSSEALYQAMRFPHLPDVQRRILEQRSPMGAKMVSKPWRSEHTRADWGIVRVNMMRWCLWMKLSCNRASFGTLLESTGERKIVEISKRDQFWGAKPAQGGLFEGCNALGLLLEELRDSMQNREPPRGCILLGAAIEGA